MSDETADDSNESQLERDAVKGETARIKKVQHVVAVAQQVIATQVQTRGEALAVIEGVKKYTLNLFPESDETFELIYRPRLQRIYEERFSRGGSAERNGQG